MFCSVCFFLHLFIEDMNDQGTEASTTNQEGMKNLLWISHTIEKCYFLEQNVLPTPKETQQQQQQPQQINVVDDAALQAVLSSMSETEMNAFLEELNKTGKACTKTNNKDFFY